MIDAFPKKYVVTRDQIYEIGDFLFDAPHKNRCCSKRPCGYLCDCGLESLRVLIQRFLKQKWPERSS